MPLKSIYNINLGFIKQKCIFEHYSEVKAIKKSYKKHYFCHKNCSVYLFRAAPFRLVFVLH
jgi:hypothetical protein